MKPITEMKPYDLHTLMEEEDEARRERVRAKNSIPLHKFLKAVMVVAGILSIWAYVIWRAIQ